MATNTITSPGTSIVSSDSVTISWELDSGYGNRYGYLYYKAESASSWSSQYISNPYSNNSYTLDTSSWTSYGKYYVYLKTYGSSGNIQTPQILLVKSRTDKVTQILKMKYGTELIEIPLYSSSGNSNKLKMDAGGTVVEADVDDNSVSTPTIKMMVGDNKKKLFTNRLSPFYSYGSANYISYYYTYYYTYYYPTYTEDLSYYKVFYGFNLYNQYYNWSTTTYSRYKNTTASRYGYTRRTTYGYYIYSYYATGYLYIGYWYTYLFGYESTSSSATAAVYGNYQYTYN